VRPSPRAPQGNDVYKDRLGRVSMAQGRIRWSYAKNNTREIQTDPLRPSASCKPDACRHAEGPLRGHPARPLPIPRLRGDSGGESMGRGASIGCRGVPSQHGASIDRSRRQRIIITRDSGGRGENPRPMALRSKGGRARLTRRGSMLYQPGTERCK
jgi:hypothetical protein